MELDRHCRQLVAALSSRRQTERAESSWLIPFEMKPGGELDKTFNGPTASYGGSDINNWCIITFLLPLSPVVPGVWRSQDQNRIRLDVPCSELVWNMKIMSANPSRYRVIRAGIPDPPPVMNAFRIVRRGKSDPIGPIM